MWMILSKLSVKESCSGDVDNWCVCMYVCVCVCVHPRARPHNRSLTGNSAPFFAKTFLNFSTVVCFSARAMINSAGRKKTKARAHSETDDENRFCIY